MSEFLITEAQREQLIGCVAFTGPSGAGKTLGSLKVAKGMMDAKYGGDLTDSEKWKKIGVIDTEHSRSKIYANTTGFGLEIHSFIHLDFTAPFSVDRLDKAVLALKSHGCEVIIIDSLSHFWEGDGGILDLQQKYGGNFQAWREVNPTYGKFISIVTGERHEVDILACMRAKQAYEVTENEVGKLKVEKLGLKPVQRDSLEYEFQIVFGIDMDHNAFRLKDNSGAFNTPRKLETDVGEIIYNWLKTGVDVLAEERKEKEAIIQTIQGYAESNHDEMKEFVAKTIEAAEKRYGELINMPLNRLHDFVNAVHVQEVKLNKEVQE